MILFIIILILIVFIIYNYNVIENFGGYQLYQSFIPMNWYWNYNSGTTTNMSYDLRGDPIIIPKKNFIWNNSSLFPIHNRGLNI